MKKRKDVRLAEPPVNLRKTKAKRIPRGATKSEILLFIADKGDTDSVDLKWHLKSLSGIRNKKSLRLHLSDLQEQKLLNKKSNGKGRADTYYLNAGFSTFKSVFNYLQSNKKEKKLLVTQYYRDYIASDEFLQKFIANLFLEIIRSTIKHIRKMDTTELRDAKLQDAELGTALIKYAYYVQKARNISPERATVDAFFDAHKGKGTEEQKKQNMTNIGITLINKMNVDEFYVFMLNNELVGEIVPRLPDIIIPQKERQQIQNMLKFSPTAMNYMLNFHKAEPLGILSAIIRFITWSINDDPEKAEAIHQLLKGNTPGKMSKVYDLLRDFSSVSNNSPIYTIINAGFISDYMNRNFAQPKDREEEILISDIANDTLLPKINKKVPK